MSEKGKILVLPLVALLDSYHALTLDDDRWAGLAAPSVRQVYLAQLAARVGSQDW
jgi:hypothetical protein